MTEIDLVKTMIAIKNFYPPDGVDVALVIQPRPGVCRATVLLGIVGSGIPGQSYEFREPPTEAALSVLYLAAKELLERSRTRPASTMNVLGLDLGSIGGE